MNTQEKQLVSLKLAKLAKELGFDLRCDGRWINDPRSTSGFIYMKDPTINDKNVLNVIARPTYSELQWWIREEYDLNVYVAPMRDADSLHYLWCIYQVASCKKNYGTFEEAFEAGLYAALLRIVRFEAPLSDMSTEELLLKITEDTGVPIPTFDYESEKYITSVPKNVKCGSKVKGDE